MLLGSGFDALHDFILVVDDYSIDRKFRIYATDINGVELISDVFTVFLLEE